VQGAPNSASSRRTILRVVQLVLAAVLVTLVARKIAGEWDAVTVALDQARPNWIALTLSGLVVLATYAVLIETWRVLLRGWQHDIPFMDAARIWTISNLGKYLPGKVWSITALAVMSRDYGVTAAEGATASILVTLVNTLVGFVVAFVAGASLLRLPRIAVALIAVLAAAVLASPSALPRLGALAGRIFKRDITLRPLRHSVLLTAGALTCIAWLMYGVAFWLFTKGMLGAAPGAFRDYVAVFAGSYLLGFLAIFTPAGLGAREGVMRLALARAGFAIGPADLLAVASRLWLTVLEVIPPLIFLALVRRRRLSTHEEKSSPSR
jgi:hypothetical protein